MRQAFKLSGNEEENFKKLEKVIPRILKRLNTKTIGIIPSSVLHSYTHEVSDEGLIFRCCLFKGKVKKVAFRIMEITGKEKPKYTCIIHSTSESRSFTFETRKKDHIQEINVSVNDGDWIEIFQVFPSDANTCILSDVHISVLFQLEQKDNEVKEIMTKELLSSEDDYEGI